MPETKPALAARNSAFCYFGLLTTGDRFEQLLKILPEARQAEMGAYLKHARSLTRDELTSRLRDLLRQRAEVPDVPASVQWANLPPALQRCLAVCAGETYGRQDHQK